MVVKVSGLTYPKHVSEEVDLLARALGEAGRVFLFLDYGGTLVPGPPEPEARPSVEVLQRLEQLCRVDSFSVFVVSGRTVEELRGLLGIDGIGLVGQRGFEIQGADGPTVHPVDLGVVGTLLERLELDAYGCLDSCDGVELENRGFALALRVGCCCPDVARRATERFARLVRSLDEHGQLEILYGDEAVEARMAGWHKGNAVHHILREADAEDSLAIYMGDDVTDEDAFEAVAAWCDTGVQEVPWFIPDPEAEAEPPPRALSILVAREPRPTLASLFVRGPGEVYEFLSSLAAIASALL